MATNAAPAIECEDLTIVLGGRVVLENVSFSVPSGNLLAVIGPNGGGKSVLLRALVGLIPIAKGSVRLWGMTPRQAQGRVGFVPQSAGFHRQLGITVREVVLTGTIEGNQIGWRYGAEQRRACDKVLELVRCTHLADRQISELSGGQIQRALIARALVSNPDLLLLDEPTASLDPPSGLSFYQELEGLTKGRTVVLVSHDIGVVAPLADSVACLNRQLFFHGSGAISHEAITAAYGENVDLVLHSHPHRCLTDHEDGAHKESSHGVCIHGHDTPIESCGTTPEKR